MRDTGKSDVNGKFTRNEVKLHVFFFFFLIQPCALFQKKISV